MPQIEGSVVVITGASSGIGRATAHRFAQEGARLVLAARSREALETVRDECRARGADAEAVPTDVRDEAAVEALGAAALERFGRIDTWVNVAGVIAYGRFEQVPSDVFRAVLETNLMGQVHGARTALRAFRRHQSGVLINMGSLWARVTTPDVSAYITSKFALRGFTETLHEELRTEPDIHVCLLHPQAVDTPIFDRAANYSGRPVRAVPPVVRPERLAEVIAGLVRHPRRDITFRFLGRSLQGVHALAPPLWQRMLPRAFEDGTYADGVVPANPGNVLEPVAGGRDVHGGWNTRRRGALVTAFAKTAVGGLRALARGG
jgi:NAD(P)-dependent dehydrogenase (short-subunit alcohol dehydrogenase family)